MTKTMDSINVYDMKSQFRDSEITYEVVEHLRHAELKLHLHIN